MQATDDERGSAPPTGPFPKRPVDRLIRPWQRLLHLPAAGGIVLLAATVVALVAANTSLAGHWNAFWHTHIELRVGEFRLDHSLAHWINDGLMVLFFFAIGLEIKRELVWGELRDRKNVVLPLAGALGGVALPVAIFLALQGRGDARAGWAVPMATDIAFVVGCLALLGPRVPAGLKVFLLSLAIVDDILAVLVIALFFTGEIGVGWLFGALGGFVVVVALNRIGVRRVAAYVVVGVWIWLCTLKAGVHPTVAGAALGLLTPASAWLGGLTLLTVVENALKSLRKEPRSTESRREATADLGFALDESIAPLDRLERALHPWVAFAIMPLFALANAGVEVSASSFGSAVSFAVALSLALGKPLGIVGACFLCVKLKLAKLPEGTSWAAMLGAGQLAGIGFTMSIFLATLSLDGENLAAAKSGILSGSALSLVVGCTLLALVLRRSAAPSSA